MSDLTPEERLDALEDRADALEAKLEAVRRLAQEWASTQWWTMMPGTPLQKRVFILPPQSSCGRQVKAEIGQRLLEILGDEK